MHAHLFFFDAPMVGMAEVTFGNLQDMHKKKLPTRKGRAQNVENIAKQSEIHPPGE